MEARIGLMKPRTDYLIALLWKGPYSNSGALKWPSKLSETRDI